MINGHPITAVDILGIAALILVVLGLIGLEVAHWRGE